MDIHQNARTTPHSRDALVRRVRAGELAKSVAAGVGVCDKTVRKWAGRFSRDFAREKRNRADSSSSVSFSWRFSVHSGQLRPEGG